MKLLLPKADPATLWHDIIHEAEAACMISLRQELEAYLVILLMRFTRQPQIAKDIMASEFMRSLKLRNAERVIALQGVGDKCLIFSGLFPQIAEKRLVKISYFVGLGKAAYDAASGKNSDVFGLLSRHFVPVMDVLQSVRQSSQEYPDLLPLQAYDLWQDTGSQRALRMLKSYTTRM